MSQDQTGNQELGQKLDDLLQEYNEKLKLGTNNSPINTFDQYASMNKDQLDGLTADRCMEISLELMQYSIFIQREINRERARLNMCENYINDVAPQFWNNYKDSFMSTAMKINAIAKENPVLQKVITLKNKIDALLISVDHLPSLIKSYADKFENYGKTRKWINH